MKPTETRVERAIRIERAELQDKLDTVLSRLDKAIAYQRSLVERTPAWYDANSAIRDLDRQEVAARRALDVFGVAHPAPDSPSKP